MKYDLQIIPIVTIIMEIVNYSYVIDTDAKQWHYFYILQSAYQIHFKDLISDKYLFSNGKKKLR